jgi:hypothetical protein
MSFADTNGAVLDTLVLGCGAQAAVPAPVGEARVFLPMADK